MWISLAGCDTVKLDALRRNDIIFRETAASGHRHSHRDQQRAKDAADDRRAVGSQREGYGYAFKHCYMLSHSVSRLP